MSTTKTKRAPKRTSDKKRPNKTFIQQMADFRGHMTGNEALQLMTLDIKNRLQKINNRAMSDDTNINFTTSEVKELTKAIKSFNKIVDRVIIKRAN